MAGGRDRGRRGRHVQPDPDGHALRGRTGGRAPHDGSLGPAAERQGGLRLRPHWIPDGAQPARERAVLHRGRLAGGAGQHHARQLAPRAAGAGDNGAEQPGEANLDGHQGAGGFDEVAGGEGKSDSP